MNDLVKRAARYAARSHGRIGQRRKYTGKPYAVHLAAVAGWVASVTDDPAMIAAAWLHDTVEDTPVTFQDIGRAFGTDVRQLVEELTDISRPGDGNRAARKAMDRAHTAQASPRAQTIKLADLIDNCLDITRHDPRFAKTFLTEATDLLEVLAQGHRSLYERARKVVADGTTRIGRK